MLKAELRDMERSQKREGVDMTYLKNVILKLLETGIVGVLFCFDNANFFKLMSLFQFMGLKVELFAHFLVLNFYF